MKHQRGLTLLGLIFFGTVLVIISIFSLKVIPAYIQHNTVKKIVTDSARGKENPQEIRNSFAKYADVNHLDVISGKDLQITREGNELVVRYAYTKTIEMADGIRLQIDFSGSSKDQ